MLNDLWIYQDRVDAGRQLARSLQEFKEDPEVTIIALPRGGVVLGYEIAKILNLPLDIISPRKIGAPFNPEFAIGAITETGEGIFSQDLIAHLHVSEKYIQETIQREKTLARERLDLYRKSRPPRELSGRKIIIVDDGIATGSTMRAAIKTVRAERAKELIVALPVGPPDTVSRLKQEVDRLICLAVPSEFYAVGQFYKNFEQVSDQEVISLLEKCK